MRARERGFTLIELIIALSLASGVMITLYAMLASMVKFQVEGAREGTIESWSIVGAMTMDREIETANVLVSPTSGSSSRMTVCQNWSDDRNGPGVGAKMDSSQPVVVTSYCFDGTHLLRANSSQSTCPGKGTAPPACNTGNYTVIATNVQELVDKNDGTCNLGGGKCPVFTRDDAINGVWVRYVVGNPNPGKLNPGPGQLQVVNPRYMTFDFRIPLTRPYSNTFD